MTGSSEAFGQNFTDGGKGALLRRPACAEGDGTKLGLQGVKRLPRRAQLLRTFRRFGREEFNTDGKLGVGHKKLFFNRAWPHSVTLFSHAVCAAPDRAGQRGRLQNLRVQHAGHAFGHVVCVSRLCAAAQQAVVCHPHPHHCLFCRE